MISNILCFIVGSITGWFIGRQIFFYLDSKGDE